ncbi:MAG: glycosyltransferase [Maribacter dokdonensis]|uniref:glycosyltransferase n=1 Tax=Flavobacteriaceae TaxID=49546 RepID=UPI0032644D3B
MAKKNIAFLLSLISDGGGIGRVTSLISNELYKLEHYNIHIISYVKSETNFYLWNQNLTYHFLREDQIPMKKGIFKASKVLRNVITKNKIDILVSCGQIVGPLGVCGSLFKNTKLIYWSHTSFKGASKKQFRMFNEHFTALFSNYLVSLTKADEINYKKETFAKKVIQIYNPIDSRIENLPRNYDETTNKIISVGRLQFEKYFEIITQVMPIILKSYPETEWHIYGSGGFKEKLENLINQNNLEGKVILKGQTNKLYELYPKYSIMVMTSRYEGFPMSLLEGLAFNLPLVSFDVLTGPNEIIREEINGYLIQPFDVEEMANKIISLLKNPEKMREFSNNNRQYIQEYSTSLVLKKWQYLLDII